MILIKFWKKQTFCHKTFMEQQEKTNTAYILIEILLLFLCVLLTVLGFINLLIVFGTACLSSRFLKKYFYTSRACHWICLYIFRPPSRYNDIIWGSFTLFFGIVTEFLKHEPNTKNTVNPHVSDFSYLLNSVEFWLLISIVVLFNLLAGVYLYKKTKKKSPH